MSDSSSGFAAGRKSLWRPVVPVPDSAPGCEFFHWEYTEVDQFFRYEFGGRLYGYVARFRTSDGGYKRLPYTWCVDESDNRGTRRWHQKMWDAPRPLFVARGALGSDPTSVPVVVVENEMHAQLGAVLVGDEFDFVSWPGGLNSWAKASWGWLAGRVVYLWPSAHAKRERLTPAEVAERVDPLSKPLLKAHRQPGVKTMAQLGTLLAAEHDCTVLICSTDVPREEFDQFEDEHGLADAVKNGWGSDSGAKIRAFIRSAHAFVPADDAARLLAQTSAALSTPVLAGAEHLGVDDDLPDLRWRDCLLRTEKEVVRAVRENVVVALDGWPDRSIPGIPEAAGVIAFNDFTNNVVKTRATPWGTPAGAWLESDELLMGEWLVREHAVPSMARNTLEEAVQMVAQRHAFHPVRERFEARRGLWDGRSRLDHWVRRCCLEPGDYLAEDDLQRYLSMAGKWFVMAMVCRVLPTQKVGPRIVRGPGTKFDYMLIFESPQGWGKSTMAEVLGGEHFADTGLMIGEKDSYQNIQGILVYEWGELENMTKQEVSKVKLFVSSAKDRFRASFDRRPRDYPRQVVFVGTTNERGYLSDVTGNRRFWPVQLTRPPDNDWLRANLDQMISEALHRLDAGDRFWPTREEQEVLFTPQQQMRTVESSLESAIKRYLFDEDQQVPMGKLNGAFIDQVQMTDLLDRIGLTLDKQTDVVVKKAGALLHALGWEVKRLSTAGRPRVYVRPSAAASASQGSIRPPQGEDDMETADGCPC